MRSHSKIYYAGGTKGPNARADGEGGLLARGWYVTNTATGRFGPFRTLTEARNHPQNSSDIVEAKHTRFEQLWLGSR
jgi:hypothetical protein